MMAMSKNNFDKIGELFTKLNEVYESLPKTTCLGCPSTGGKSVVAECCKRGVPPAYQIEFFNMLNGTSDWTEEEKEDLILKCVQTAQDPTPDKPCVFLSDNNECRIYNHRPLNCRLYGMCGGKQDKERAASWLMEQFVHEFADVEDAKYYFRNLFEGEYDPDKINAAIKKDFGVERESGIVNNECQNVAIEDGATPNPDGAWKTLESLESKLIKSNVSKSKDNPTYMAFHIAMLLHVFGPEVTDSILAQRGIS